MEPRIEVWQDDTTGLWNLETSSCAGCVFVDEYEILHVEGGELVTSSEARSVPWPSKGGASTKTYFIRPSLKKPYVILRMTRKGRGDGRIRNQSNWLVHLQ